MTKLKIAILLKFLLLFSSCSYFSKEETNFINGKGINNDFILKNWKVTGPFYTDSLFYARGLIDYPVLNYYKILNDSSITSEVINSIEKDNYLDSLFYLDTFTNSSYAQKQGYIDLKNYFDIEKTGIVYLSCHISSDKSKEIAFLLGSDDASSVYLNGKEIYKHTAQRNYLCSENRFFGHLKKGDNFLLVKLANECPKSLIGKNKQEWRFSCNLSSLNRFYSFYLKNQTNYFKSCVVPKFFPLELKEIFNETRQINKVHIYNADKILAHTQEERLDTYEVELPDNFVSGLYYADLITNASDTLRQPFYYGDIDAGLSKKVLQAQSIIDTCKSVRLKNALQPLLLYNFASKSIKQGFFTFFRF